MKVRPMKKYLASFAQDETGAITVDWVVITAAVVVLAMAVGLTVATGAGNLSAEVGDSLSSGMSN